MEGVSHAELLAAVENATALEFGPAVENATALEFGPADADAASKPAGDPVPASTSLVRKRDSVVDHLAFLVALALGGTLAVLTGGADPAGSMALVQGAADGRSWLVPVLFGVGGLFVGFGTRMAGGCTSGHGLCGVSRFQNGSLLATLMFFASGVATAFLLGAVL